MVEGPLQLYRDMRRRGELKPDPGQALAAEKLQSLHNALRGYEPSTGRGGWKERLGLGRRRVEPPQGLYIFGGVGTGKSLLMDLFYARMVGKKRSAGEALNDARLALVEDPKFAHPYYWSPFIVIGTERSPWK